MLNVAAGVTAHRQCQCAAPEIKRVPSSRIMEGEMGNIDRRAVGRGALLAAVFLVVASTECWWSVAWAQQPPFRFSPGPDPTSQPTPALEIRSGEPSRTSLVGGPTVDANTPLESALAACDKAAEGYEPTSLPGAKREIKLDQCYRGRDHLVCTFSAILAEA